MRDAYMGIDQSYSGFSIVFWDPDLLNYTAWSRAFSKKEHGAGVERLVAIDAWFRSVLSTHIVDFETSILGVCMEGYSMGAKNGREQAGELGAVVKVALHDTGLSPTIVPPTSLKKFTTGKGNAAKNEMLLGVYKKWGFEFSDDNEADAFALSRLAEAIDRGATTRYEEEVIARLSDS
jgi:Holliday junction resolvasome RuvABC endonuclease subunit